MRNLILIILISILPINSYCTDNPIDKIKRYSYLIFGFYDVHDSSGFKIFKNVQGTCFFVKNNTETFLVSAKHTITPWDCEKTSKKQKFPDTLKVRLYNKDSTIYYFDIDIRKLKDTITGNNCFNDPDVFIIQCDNTLKKKVNAFELPAKIDYDSFSEVILFGFPTITLTPTTFKAFSNQVPLLTRGTTSFKKNQKISEIIDKFEKTSYAILRTDSLNKVGCSGSPVFGRKKHSKKWIFGGVFIRSDAKTGISLILKPDYVLTLINRKFGR